MRPFIENSFSFCVELNTTMSYSLSVNHTVTATLNISATWLDEGIENSLIFHKVQGTESGLEFSPPVQKDDNSKF